MGIIGRLNQYGSMLAAEFDDYSMSENLVLYSSQIGITPAYSVAGTAQLNTLATTAPNGLNEASLLDNTGNTGTNYVFGNSGVALIANTTYTYSIYIKQGTKPDFQITIDENGFGGKRYFSVFTYSTETVTSGITGGTNDGVVIGSTAVKLPNGWYRLSLTFRTSTTNVSGFVDMINRFGNTSGSNYVWGRQLEYGSVATDYTPTTTTIINRVLSSSIQTNISATSTYFSSGFDENTSITRLSQTGENLFLYSEQYNQSNWINSGSTELIDTTATLSPDGLYTADKLIGNNGEGTRQSIYQNVSVTSGVTYTFSVFLKQAERRYATIWFDNPSITEGPYYGAGTNIDLQTGTAINVSGNPPVTFIIPYPNGWYRCYVTATPSFTGNLSLNIAIGTPNNSLDGSQTLAYQYTGDGVSGIYVWGAQFERGLTPTDYIPTTTTTSNRSLPSPIFALSANVFPPYDSVYDEFGGTLFGAGQGRYMRQNTNKSVIVYNEIDEITDFYGRGIVRDGLFLDLDAGIASSYPGTGTTWTDLSPYSNNGIFAPSPASPTFNSSNGGYLNFDGGDYVDCGLATFQPTSLSLCAWVRHTNSTDGGIIVKGDVNEATEWGLSFGYSAPHYVIGRATTFNNQLVHPWTGSLLTGFHHICYTIVNNTRATLYVDGIQVASTNTIGSIGLNAKNVLIGKWNNYAPLQGDIAQASIYTRELTALEVLQNYNALKHRFGL